MYSRQKFVFSTGFQIPLTITLPAGVGGGVVCVVVITVGVLCLCVCRRPRRHSRHHSRRRRITNTPSTECLLSGNDVEKGEEKVSSVYYFLVYRFDNVILFYL